MARTISAQFVRKCMLFSNCATLCKMRRIIYFNIHFFYLLLQYFLRKWQRVEKLNLRTINGINLRTIIQEFLEARDLPEDLDIRDEFIDNKMSKQKRCTLCPSSLDRKTLYKCLRCAKAMCKEHVAKICCECAKKDGQYLKCDISAVNR